MATCLEFFSSGSRDNEAPACVCCCCSGAILASLEVLGSRSITLKQYNEQPVLPDWCSLYEPEEKEDKTLLALKTDKPVGTSSLAAVTSEPVVSGPAGESGTAAAAAAATTKVTSTSSPRRQQASPAKSHPAAASAAAATTPKARTAVTSSAKTVSSTPQTQ